MRKKTILATLALAAGMVFTTEALAQKKQELNGWWLGGSVGYWHDKEDGLKVNSFAIAPEVGYDFNDRWSLAGVIGYAYEKAGDVSADIFVIEPYARYKFVRQDRFCLFVDGGFGFAMGDADGFKIGLTPGVSYRVSEHFSLLASSGFLGYKKDHYNNGSGKGFGFDLSSQNLKFGFIYAF